MKKHITALLALALACAAAQAQKPSETVLQIGVKDGSEKEFGLYGQHYGSIRDNFKDGRALYSAGIGSAKDIPFVIPGPDDAWAGNPNGGIFMNFSLKEASSAGLRLVMDFVETHPLAPPVLEVTLNGFRTELRTPRGSDQHYLDKHRTSSTGLTAELDIPAGNLKKGANLLSVSIKRGSWMVLDDIRLLASEKVSVVRSDGGVSLISASSEPALVYGKTKDEVLHPVTLTFANWTSRTKTAWWSYDGGKGRRKVEVPPGVSKVDAGIPEGYAGKEVELSVECSGEVRGSTVKVADPEKWTIYLVQHTHTDIGYTKPQTEILTEHLRYIDYAVEYCKATEDYPDDSKFRWTCESSWAVREWLRIRPKQQVEDFLGFVRNGQIEVTAMFFNMSELSGENNYKTFLEPLAEFRKRGIPVVTAMQNDVNGLAWNLADYLPDLGVKYITMGSNGHRASIPFNRPTVYKWEAPSGKSLVSFRADVYHTANYWGLDKGNYEGVRNGVFNYINSLKDRGYPFPCITVQYSGYYTDNSPPSIQECEIIRQWNDHYAWPKLRSATAREFLENVEKNHSDKLPVFRAAYPDWWTDGFGSAARETAASRSTQSDMLTIESMLSMSAMLGDDFYPSVSDEVRRIHENLLFYDEHTFGAAESISDPTCENSNVQWAEKGSYVWEALKSAQMMYETASGRLQGEVYRSQRPTITFFNPLGTSRDALCKVFIDFELIPRDRAYKIVDRDGRPLRSQPLSSRSEGRYYHVWAEDIPAMGYKTYEIVLEEGGVQAPAPFELAEGKVYENEWYRAAFDGDKGGISSLFDKESGKELVDQSSEWNFGAFIYESLEKDRHQMERKVFEKFSRTGLRNVSFTGKSSGEVYNSVYYEGDADGCTHRVRVEVRFYNAVKRIEMCYSMRRSPERDPSGIYVAFPFAVEDGKMALDVPGGVLTPGENQIPGTSTAWNTVQNFVSAKNGEMQAVVSCDEVPLFMMGELLDDPYRLEHHHTATRMYSWVMNNYWTTNFRAFQEGELIWEYAITTSPDNSNSFASEFGWSNRVPMWTRVMPAAEASNGKEREVSFLTVRSESVQMLSCVPSKVVPGDVLVNVREMDGKASTLSLVGRDGKPLGFKVVNVLDEGDAPSATSLEVKPYQNLFLRVQSR